jgi:hypothetical protein
MKAINAAAPLIYPILTLTQMIGLNVSSDQFLHMKKSGHKSPLLHTGCRPIFPDLFTMDTDVFFSHAPLE